MYKFSFLRNWETHKIDCETLEQAQDYSRRMPCDEWKIYKSNGQIPSGSGLYSVTNWVLVESSEEK